MCDLAADRKWTDNTPVTVYTNGKPNKFPLTVDPLGTKIMMGGTGRISSLYDVGGSLATRYILVYKDTYLAEVTDVTERTFDRGGHLEEPSVLTLDIYDGRMTITPAIK